MENNDNQRLSDNETVEALTLVFHKLRDHAAELSRTPENGDTVVGRASIPSLYLYDGISGLALFFAAYYSVTKEPEAQRLAIILTAPLQREVGQLVASRTEPPPIGGIVGLGSLLYTFVRLADWLKAPEFLDLAMRVNSAITRELILSDDQLHIMQGCAGTLLSLLAFAQEAQARGMDSQSATDSAILCGRHLLRCRVPSPAGPRAWPSIQRPPMCGFAHGASGISYALMRLFGYTRQEEFLEAALEGFAFENTLYVPELRAWVDPRFNWVWSSYSWCHGAPGMALARMGSMEYADVPALHQSMEEALSVTRSASLSSTDHLCCGNFGRIEVLHTAGSVLDRLQLSDYALELSRQILARSKTSGFYLLPPDECHDTTKMSPRVAAMFTGLSGVGYTLLRLLYPGFFPSILLLESRL